MQNIINDHRKLYDNRHKQHTKLSFTGSLCYDRECLTDRELLKLIPKYISCIEELISQRDKYLYFYTETTNRDYKENIDKLNETIEEILMKK